MSGPSVVVRGREYREPYMELVRAVFPSDALDRKARAWDWFFANPFSEGENQTRLFVVEKNGASAAMSIGIPGRFVVGGHTFTSMSAMTTMASPEHPGEGLRIIRNYFLKGEPPLVWGLTNTPRLNKVCVRLGATESPNRTLRQCVLRPAALVRKRLKLPSPLAAGIDLIGAPAMRLAGLRGARLGANERIVPIEVFGDGFDTAWQRAAPNQACTQVRNSVFLNWRYVDCPIETYERRALYRGDTLVAFAVLCVQSDRGMSVGRVTDIFSYAGDTRDFGLLLADANRMFRKAGCAYSELVFGQSAALETAAQRAGFFIRKDQRPVVMVITGGAEKADLATNIRHFHMCRGDQDEDY